MFSANQKPFVVCTCVISFALVLQVRSRVTEELHAFLSQSELSNFFVYIINVLISKMYFNELLVMRSAFKKKAYRQLHF